GGRRGRRGGTAGHRCDQPPAGEPRLDPRRLRDRRRPEHGARLGLTGVGRARGGAVLPGARLSRPLVLASRSPQRRAILSQLGIAFTVEVPDVEELEEGPPDEVALENAYRKAAAVAARRREELVLGVDTLVAIGTRIYGKPADEREARATLEALSGRRHLVLSGVCVIERDRTLTSLSATGVEFRHLDRT